MNKKIICIDFDGVIYPNLKYMGSCVLHEEPIKNTKSSLKKKSENYKIIIHSSRFNDDEAFQAVKNYLKKHDIYYDTSRYKPTAFIYLDDRGIQFNGNWDETIEEIDNFKQWQNKHKNMIRTFKKHGANIPIIK